MTFGDLKKRRKIRTSPFISWKKAFTKMLLPVSKLLWTNLVSLVSLSCRSARALKRITPTDSPGSSSFPSSHYHHIKIPLTLEVVDHLDCHCALQVLNQVKVLASSQKGSLGSLMEPSQSPQMRPEDSSPTIHPIFTSTAFPPSSGSSPSLSSLANGSSESYQTCLACKKQAEICEESEIRRWQFQKSHSLLSS